MTYQWPPQITAVAGANPLACICQPETFLLVPVKPGEFDGDWSGVGGRYRLARRYDSDYRLMKHRGECPLTDEVWFKDRRIM